MADPGQPFHPQQSVARNCKVNNGDHIGPSLDSSNPSIDLPFDQLNPRDENPCYSDRSTHQDDVTEEDFAWLRNFTTLEGPRAHLGFNTAPPNFNPPSQVQSFRGYHTDPQLYNGHPRGLPAFTSTDFNGGEDVNFERCTEFGGNKNDHMNIDRVNMSQMVQDLTADSSDDNATSLITSYVQLYPTTFFFKEKVAALATLTNIPPKTVEKVMSQVLANRPPTRSGATNSSTFSRTSFKRGSTQTRTREVSRRLTHRPIPMQAAQSLLDGRAEKCQPISDNTQLLRDEQKIYQCTFKCGARFGRKAELKRHEEEKNYPQRVWICDVDAAVVVKGIHTCAYCELQNPPKDHATVKHANRVPFCHEKEIDARGKIFTRKKRFEAHFEVFHPALPIADYLETCRFAVNSKFPGWCGFCKQSQDFDGSKSRNDHMAGHFENGLDMTKWSDANGSDNTTDEDGDTDRDTNGDTDGEDERESGSSNDEMDEDKSNRSPSAKRRRRDGPSGGSSSQDATRTFNYSLSALTLNESCQPDVNRNDGSSQHRSDADLVLLSLGACKIEPQSKPSFAAVDSSSSSSQLASRQDEELQNSQTQQSGTEKVNLRMALRKARVYSERDRFFIPITELQRLITFDNVLSELKTYYRDTEWNTAILKDATNIILRDGRTLFAILVFVGKGLAIPDLILLGGISDLDLPISWTRINEIPAFNKWSDQAIEDFGRNQWSFISPVLGQVGLHHEFDDHVILPFIKERQSLAIGGYSDVWSAKIHPAHQKFFPSSPETPPLAAVKQLYSIDPKDFEAETMMLRQLAKKNHPHIVRLLATFRINRRYHLVFPLANKNLRTYWQDNPDPQWNREEVLWTFRQILGVTSAIYTIHNFNTQFATFPETLYGRHGDIKPENILYFEKLDGKDRILQVTDFGLGQFRSRHSRSNVDPRTVMSTPTYEPPEIALLRPVSRAYDIWSLGCVFLEFMTWTLGGHKLLEKFSATRFALGENGVSCDDKFYTISQGVTGTANAYVRRSVLFWVEQLFKHKKCSKAVQDILDLIRNDLLVVDAQERMSSRSLLYHLQKLLERAETDEVYLLQPYVEWEISQSIAVVSRNIEDLKALGNGGMNVSWHGNNQEIILRKVASKGHERVVGRPMKTTRIRQKTWNWLRYWNRMLELQHAAEPIPRIHRNIQCEASILNQRAIYCILLEAALLTGSYRCTFGTQDFYRADHVSSAALLPASTQLWPSGPISSEAARYPWLTSCRNVRLVEARQIPNFGAGSCFHDGYHRLNAFYASYEIMMQSLCKYDIITQGILDKTVGNTLRATVMSPTPVHFWAEVLDFVAWAAQVYLDKLDIKPSQERSVTYPSFVHPRMPEQISHKLLPFSRLLRAGNEDLPISSDHKQVTSVVPSDTGPALRKQDQIYNLEATTNTGKAHGRAQILESPINWLPRYREQLTISPPRPDLSHSGATKVGEKGVSDNLSMGIDFPNLLRQKARFRHSYNKNSTTANNRHDPAGSNRQKSNKALERSSPTPGQQIRADNAPLQSDWLLFKQTGAFTMAISLGNALHVHGAQSRKPTVSQQGRAQPLVECHSRPRLSNSQPNSTHPALLSPFKPPQYCSVEELLEWKYLKKTNIMHRQSAVERLQFERLEPLGERDCVFLIDDSTSMRPYWDEVKRVFLALSCLVEKSNGNRIDLYFTNDSSRYSFRDTKPFMEILDRRIQAGNTDIEYRLKKILQSYQHKLGRHIKRSSFLRNPLTRKIRPMSIYMLTDRRWREHYIGDNRLDSLTNLTKSTCQTSKVRIQFVSFDSDPTELERLVHLDSYFEAGLDIVNTTHLTGSVEDAAWRNQ